MGFTQPVALHVSHHTTSDALHVSHRTTSAPTEQAHAQSLLPGPTTAVDARCSLFGLAMGALGELIAAAGTCSVGGQHGGDLNPRPKTRIDR